MLQRIDMWKVYISMMGLVSCVASQDQSCKHGVEICLKR
jgi:hypothetical protein